MSQIVDKIQKLLRLAQSSNPHEAASAAARAQELMHEHKIAMADLEIAGGEVVREAVGTEPLETTGKVRVRWKGWVANAAAKSFGCRTFWRGATIQLVGRPGDVQAARYVYQFLILEIERLAAEGCPSYLGAAQKVQWKNSFRTGACVIIEQRLGDQSRMQAAATSSTALVLVKRDEAEVEAAMPQKLGKGTKNAQRLNWEAFHAGREAGASIQLSGGKQLGASKTRIGGVP